MKPMGGIVVRATVVAILGNVVAEFRGTSTMWLHYKVSTFEKVLYC